MSNRNNNTERTFASNDALVDVETVSQTFGISQCGVWRGVQRGELPMPVKLGKCSRWVQSELIEAMGNLKAARNN